jgi:hypothetical protein
MTGGSGSPDSSAAVAGGECALRALALLSVVAALIVPVVGFVLLFPLVRSIPTWDQWSMIEVWSAHFTDRPVLPLLLEPYNGHFNVLPRLFFFGLGLLSHWDIRLEVVASYVAAGGTLALLLRMLARQGRHALALALPIACQVFSLLQYENFMSGYPFGQNLSQFLAILALSLLSAERLRTVSFAAAGAAAMASTLSWGAGLATWFVGFVVLLLRGERRPARFGAWLGFTLIATAVVKLSAGGAFGGIFWERVPPFFFALLGKAWSPRAMPSFRLAAAMGVVAFLLFTGLAAWGYRRLRAASLPWTSLGLYSLAASGLIALGRAGAGLEQALASHYVTATYPLVVACTVLGVLLLLDLRVADRRLRWIPRTLAAAAALAAALQPAAASAEMLPVLRSWDPIVYGNAVAIARGTASDAAIQTSHHPSPQLVRSGTEVLRVNRLAWFRDLLDGHPPWGVVERFAGQLAAKRPIVVAGDLPWTVEGWAVRARHAGGPVKAVHLLVDGRRRASAVLDFPRHDVADFFGSADFLASGWVISLPAGALGSGAHRVTVAAADYNDGLFTLLETDVLVLAPAREVESPGLVGDQHELGAQRTEELPLPP